jgi:hypothetical protein
MRHRSILAKLVVVILKLVRDRKAGRNPAGFSWKFGSKEQEQFSL